VRGLRRKKKSKRFARLNHGPKGRKVQLEEEGRGRSRKGAAFPLPVTKKETSNKTSGTTKRGSRLRQRKEKKRKRDSGKCHRRERGGNEGGEEGRQKKFAPWRIPQKRPTAKKGRVPFPGGCGCGRKKSALSPLRRMKKKTTRGRGGKGDYQKRGMEYGEKLKGKFQKRGKKGMPTLTK